MKRLASLWNAILCGRNEPVYVLRIWSIMIFAVIAGALMARQFHYSSLCDFFIGMAFSFAGLLIFHTFRLESAEYKRDPHASDTIELHLSH